MSKKVYLTNPITDELIRDGIIEVSKREELRIIKDKEGNTHQEIAVTIRYKDPRKFVKSFPDFNTKMLQLFEGNSKAQMPYILAAAIERSINKDYVYLTHRDVISICEDRGVKPLDKTQLSKGIKWILESGKKIDIHNFNFDALWTKRHLCPDLDFYKINNYDTMIIHHFLTNSINDVSNGLKESSFINKVAMDWEGQLDEAKREICQRDKLKLEDFTYEMFDVDMLTRYAGLDTIVLCEYRSWCRLYGIRV